MKYQNLLVLKAIQTFLSNHQISAKKVLKGNFYACSDCGRTTRWGELNLIIQSMGDPYNLDSLNFTTCKHCGKETYSIDSPRLVEYLKSNRDIIIKLKPFLQKECLIEILKDKPKEDFNSQFKNMTKAVGSQIRQSLFRQSLDYQGITRKMIEEDKKSKGKLKPTKDYLSSSIKRKINE